MINKEKWIESLPKANRKFASTISQLDGEIWTNTLPKKNSFTSVKKYSFMLILFTCGLLFVSAIKNETRNLQKEINNLEASIGLIKFNLDQAVLDNEVITSPENISMLAKEHLNIELSTYKKSQIRKLNDTTENITEVNKVKKEINNTNKTTIILKSEIAKKVEKKKLEIKKLQEIYSNPKSLPSEVKKKVAKEIKQKKTELENIYESPKNILSYERVGRWTIIQVVKAFLGMPIIPGR